ncbi:MAG TPA: DUF2076 domain-containing protein, partial [Erwiniaceae bacterium]|nr:DUF2076 domain-containing protein [Erwiniaceae bacterium]
PQQPAWNNAQQQQPYQQPYNAQQQPYGQQPYSAPAPRGSGFLGGAL